jgi:uncharacterized protein (TIGR04255 family)
MPIPESPRIIYAKNPLKEVVCQLKFPTILRIESETPGPAGFQEAVRGQFPIYREPQGALGEGVPADLARLVGSMVPLAGPKVYEFLTEDGTWKLTLSRDFIALSCSKYERWEVFKNYFDHPFRVLLSEYRPAFFSRVGLRYQNIIRRKALGLEGSPWSELLESHIAGPLDTEIASDISEAYHRVSFRLPDNQGKVTMVHGLVQESPEAEPCYVIDNDFYSEERSQIEHATEKLDNFNKQSGRVFRWSVKDKLDRAMQPKSVQQ